MQIKYIIRQFLKKVARPYLLFKRKKTGREIKKMKENPKELASFLYRKTFGRSINWENPTEWNEKLRWLQFNTDTTAWSLLADKYLVRDYLQQRGYGDILTKLYGVWDKAEEIDFDALPQSFVLKTNHGYGEVLVVRDKTKISIEDVRDKINQYLNTPFGNETAELHYLTIPPRIIAEELLPADSSFSSSIVDYKFYCFSGKPLICGVYFDRNPLTHKTSSIFYDMDWKKRPEWKNPILKQFNTNVPKPKTFDLMKSTCESLCKDLPFCRLDFYEAKGKMYFGEFTFTPASCSGGSLNPKMFNDLGRLIKIKK